MRCRRKQRDVASLFSALQPVKLDARIASMQLLGTFKDSVGAIALVVTEDCDRDAFSSSNAFPIKLPDVTTLYGGSPKIALRGKVAHHGTFRFRF